MVTRTLPPASQTPCACGTLPADASCAVSRRGRVAWRFRLTARHLPRRFKKVCSSGNWQVARSVAGFLDTLTRSRSLAFSPDGKLVASGSMDYTALVWDVTGMCPDGKWSLRDMQSDEMGRLWDDLAGTDGVRAFGALWKMVAA